MKYYKIILFLVIISLSFSCQNTYNKNFTVKGNIKGLTKGTVYLEKIKDTVFIPIDSFVVVDNGDFILGDDLESPEIYYLRIKEVPNEKILVFGENGIVKLHTKLEKFSLSAKVSGSENHDLLQEYKEMSQRFNDSQLDIFKANFEAEKRKDSIALDSLEKNYKSLQRRKYLYTTNFAVKHADKEVAPYIALTELYNANISLLDTVNKSLTEKIKKSKYGKQLDRFITVIKKNEGKDLLD
jgi:hypothetical protein